MLQCINLKKKKRHPGGNFRKFNDDSNHEISEKRSSFSLTESLSLIEISVLFSIDGNDVYVKTMNF